MKSVLIFSKWSSSSSVALAVEQVRARGQRAVLISPFADDCNRDRCDDQVLLDWTTEDVPALIGRLDERGIVPTAVVNLVEPLIPWQIAVAGHYGLPGAEAARNVLVSKTLVREHMREQGLSAIRFCSDPAEVDFFPVIVKPARESAASWLVRRANRPADLVAYQAMLAELGVADTELIIEEYVPGTEFSVDGPVMDGRFHPILAVERPEHDDSRHHNAGLQIRPPQQEHVRAGVRRLSAMIGKFCADLRIDQLWVHAEGRVDDSGRTELVEINPRPAGGMYSPVIRMLSGIDPMDAFVAMALGDFTVTMKPQDPLHPEPLVGFYDVEAEELGTVEIVTTKDDLRALPGMIDAEVIDGFRITSLEKENFFIRVVYTADSVGELRARTVAILDSLDYRVRAPAPAAG